jgi:hypothetical protein
MNEFEWRRQMRELRQPLVPRRDLWASIEGALDDAEPRTLAPPPPTTEHDRSRRWRLGAAVAASLLLASGIAWHLQHSQVASTVAYTPMHSVKWKPADPRLAGAAIELDAARMELQQALQQSPDSSGLRRILARTEQQQAQLRQLAREPG